MGHGHVGHETATLAVGVVNGCAFDVLTCKPPHCAVLYGLQDLIPSGHNASRRAAAPSRYMACPFQPLDPRPAAHAPLTRSPGGRRRQRARPAQRRRRREASPVAPVPRRALGPHQQPPPRQRVVVQPLHRRRRRLLVEELDEAEAAGLACDAVGDDVAVQHLAEGVGHEARGGVGACGLSV